MDTLCLFGGGRWSRVLLGVLHKSFPELKSIVWLSKYNYDQNSQWLLSQNFLNVILVQEDVLAWVYKPDAIIVANASHLHGLYVKEAILRHIPVLSEKPFCLSISDGHELSKMCKKHKAVAGVNFEFIYASYLGDFKYYLEQESIHSLEMTWQDPFCEIRYGEQKFGDIYTPLMYDSFQHCWSILKFLLPNELPTLHDVIYNTSDSSVLITLRALSVSITIHLSRRAKERKRIIAANHGEISLDFSVEPGFVVIGDKKVQNEWKGMKPLQAVFNSFFNVIREPKLIEKWPLYLGNCMDGIHLSAKASQLLEASHQASLLKKKPLLVQSIETRNLLVDMFLPKLSIAGQYHRVHDEKTEMDFCEYIIKMHSIFENG